MSHYDIYRGHKPAFVSRISRRRACDAARNGEDNGMFSGLSPSTNFLLRIALAFGAGLMMAALL